MLDNPSLLLERSFAIDGGDALADHQHILVANFSEDNYCLQLAQAFPDKHFTAFSYNFAAYQKLSRPLQYDDNQIDNLDVICDHQLQVEGLFDCVVIYFPKSKPEFEFLINNLFNLVQQGAPVYVVGDNKGGVKTCAKTLSQFCTPVKKVDAAKHCALFLTTLNAPSPPFVLEDWYKCYVIDIKGIKLDIYTLPGVFSHGALDMGTRILLENINHKPKAKILDFGCGAGLIGAYLSKLNPNVTVTGLDVSTLAIQSTLKTYQANQINGQVLLSNGLSEVKSAFNQVYSNPPFHSGVKTNYAITEQFLTHIKAKIYPHGSLTIVANSFLKYQPLLEQQFGRYETLISNRRFNVYHATRGRN